jgi:RND family efflux transporter MFP subunit
MGVKVRHSQRRLPVEARSRDAKGISGLGGPLWATAQDVSSGVHSCPVQNPFLKLRIGDKTMGGLLVRMLVLGLMWTLFLASEQGYCQSGEKSDLPWRAGSEQGASEVGSPAEPAERSGAVKSSLWNTTIVPYRTADVGPEVAGVIKEVWVDEGDVVKEGQVVARLYNARYVDVLRKAEARLAGLEAELKKAEEEIRIQEELFALKAATRQDLLKAKTEVEVVRSKVKEAQKEEDIARKDLDACVIKAPFSGSVAVRHKQPDEPCERMGKVLSLVDNSKVFAVANIEEQAAPAFEKGARAVFVHRSGKTFEGIIDRVGSVMDSKAKTTKVYCLLDNSSGSLSAGMTGTLRVVGQ